MNAKLSDELKKEAIDLGLCEPWQKSWDGSIEGLASMYIRGMDFCVEHDYPSLSCLENNFKGKVRHFGIYISEDVNLISHGRVMACVGSCTGKMNLLPMSSTRLYLRHTSNIKIRLGAKGFLMIDAHENSTEVS